jgi:ribonuclease P protein component
MQFTKQERIVSKKLVEALFAGNGSHSLAAFPLRVVYMKCQRTAANPPAQILISVPKRHFKHAVDRNRAKRQIREAYRQNKQLLTDHLAGDEQLAIAFIWLSDQPQSSKTVSSQVKHLLKRIADKQQS